METNSELYEYIKENFIDDTFKGDDLEGFEAPVERANHLNIENQSEKACEYFEKILLCSPYKKELNTGDLKLDVISLHKKHKTIFTDYVEPIVNYIYTNKIDIDIFNEFLLDLGLTVEGSHIKTITFVNLWLTSGNWGNVLDQNVSKKIPGDKRTKCVIDENGDFESIENKDGESIRVKEKVKNPNPTRGEDRARAYNHYKIVDKLKVDEKKAQYLWTNSNDSIAQFTKDLLVKIDSKHTGLINFPYFLVYIGYEVLIALLFDLENKTENYDNDLDGTFINHLYAIYKFITERENSTTAMDDKLFNRAPSKESINLRTVTNIGKITNTLIKDSNKENYIIWSSVFSKRIHIMSKQIENMKTKDDTVIQCNFIRIAAIIKELNTVKRVNKDTVKRIKAGLDQFIVYVRKVSKEGNGQDYLGGDTQGGGDVKRIFYGWGYAFHQLIMDLTEQYEKNDHQLIKYFLLSNLHSSQTRHTDNRPFKRQQLENLHSACIQQEVTPYKEIHSMLDREWNYGKSRDFISKNWEVKNGK